MHAERNTRKTIMRSIHGNAFTCRKFKISFTTFSKLQDASILYKPHWMSGYTEF